MEFNLDSAIAVLSRTPGTLASMLDGLDPGWTHVNEGAETWSAYDIVGHLIHGEKTDWIPRARHILEHGDRKAFEPFDRFAQLKASRVKKIGELIAEFAALRRASIEALRKLELDAAALDRKGKHPELGGVTMRQLLATWVVHDLGHIAQFSRVMAKRYADDVGPWRAYLPVLEDRQR